MGGACSSETGSVSRCVWNQSGSSSHQPSQLNLRTSKDRPERLLQRKAALVPFLAAPDVSPCDSWLAYRQMFVCLPMYSSCCSFCSLYRNNLHVVPDKRGAAASTRGPRCVSERSAAASTSHPGAASPSALEWCRTYHNKSGNGNMCTSTHVT